VPLTTLACDKVTHQTGGLQAESIDFPRQNVRSVGARAALGDGVNLDCVAVINVFVHSLFLKGV
jgi:hypothetical protein